ncbi:MAG: PSD1 and planctomycete cytochrome C domain-containing protein [Chthoniobacter sp.]|nr:PSD1 and planctomycete cytochrome C domain-containing protein [Chthoniobacter sp.]
MIRSLLVSTLGRVGLGVWMLGCGPLRGAEDAARLAFFEQRVRPVLVEYCYECHSAESKKLKGGLRLDSRAGLLRGGETDAAVVPGDAKKSLLIEAVGYADRDLQMPPKKRLPDAVVADLTQWVNDGAFDPRDGPAVSKAPGANDSAMTHWAFQPIREITPPGGENPMDGFITAKLAERGLTQAPAADRRTLIRRAAYDLTGLPPTPEEIGAFLNDSAPDAFEKMIERFLASPRYGERWGRWWLDVARYADTNGQDENKVMANAWRYRDWVVRAFNANRRFDEFITEQLAGDLLPAAGVSDPELFERWTATGFLVLGPKILAEQDKPKLVMDLIDEQIDVVSRAFLGLTVSCARCHDHKFDPIPTRDYYALAGIFRSTKTMANLEFVSKFHERQIGGKKQRAALQAYEKELAARSAAVDAAIVRANTAWFTDPQAPVPEIPEVSDDPFAPVGALRLLQARHPLYPAETRAVIIGLEKTRDELKRNRPPADFALAVEEAKPVNLPVHIRGSHLNLEKHAVPRGFIQIASRSGVAPVPADRSGRLELARWLTGPEQPLTARVIMNRIWQAHFGEGLVRTPDNFGVRGEAPSHPELLDWLAREFMRSGWDVKRMHRLILTSAAWRQAGRSGQANAASLDHAAHSDPENRLLWHFPRQRLDAEMIRDALLAVSGRLDVTVGGSLVAWKNDEYVPKDTVSAGSRRRSVYLPVVRGRVFDLFTIFDAANPSVVTAQRTPTVVTHQALFFLNSPLVKDAARAFAQSLLVASPDDAAGRVGRAYERAFGRLPTDEETRRALEFVAALPRRDGKDADVAAWGAWCQVLFAANEFVYRE